MTNNDSAKAWEEAESDFAVHAARQHVPARGTFELTPRCNFGCKMCYVYLSSESLKGCEKKELTTKQWLHIAEEAVRNGTLSLLLTGGEPLIRNDFAEFYTEINKMGFMISLNTNGSLMNEKYRGLFAKYPPTSVSVTLYGADREVYGSITGNPDNFDKTVIGLEYLSQIDTVLEVKATFIRDNMHQLDRMRETANRFTKQFAINYMVFKPIPGVVSQAETCRLAPKECIGIELENEWYYHNLKKKNVKVIERAIDASFERDYGTDISPRAVKCLAAKSAYSISWDGRMLPCATFDDLYTEPFKEGFKEAWDRLPSLFKDVAHPKKCVECKYFNYCPNCPAYFRLETGAYDRVSDYICELAHERNHRYEELHKV